MKEASSLNGQDKVFSELVQSLLEPAASGYNVALLVCGKDSPEKTALMRGDGRQPGIVQQVIENTFQATQTRVKEEQCLLTASFIQFYPDGKSCDLLNPANKELTAVETSKLGIVVADAAEVVLSSPDMTYGLYLQGIETAHDPHCSTLFSMTVEQKEAINPAGFKRSVVQIFDLQGVNPKSHDTLSAPFLQILQKQDPSGSEALLPLILKQTLEGNTLCLLLYCLNMEDLSGEEIVSALSVASRLREMSKAVSPTHWDPEEEARKLRGEVRALRSKLLANNQSEESTLSQLGQALKELEVVKDQRWENKKNAPKLFKERRACRIQAIQQSNVVQGLASSDPERELMRSQRKLPFADKGKGNHKLPKDMNHEALLHGKEVESSCSDPRGGSKVSCLEPGEEILKNIDGNPKEMCPQKAKSIKGGTFQHLDVDLVFSLAQSRRHWMKTQHRALIQRELMKLEQLRPRDQMPIQDQEAVLRLQGERAVLVLQLEALRRERAEAERDVETLYQHHRQETGVQKRHVLQVFHAYRGLLEEQMDALEQRYRKLLEDSIQDAVCLSARNQQLQAENRQLSEVVKELRGTTYNNATA
ncbi:uncharacterized protein [Ambystoma mexicanum]|uniref:uncharacterized protein n=1 Tax=Ambystoma mexicanum TaxID=8296 RepID=UPI0037E822D9